MASSVASCFYLDCFTHTVQNVTIHHSQEKVTKRRCPAIELGCPAVELGCPAFELGCPAVELRYSAADLRCPAIELMQPKYLSNLEQKSVKILLRLWTSLMLFVSDGTSSHIKLVPEDF